MDTSIFLDDLNPALHGFGHIRRAGLSDAMRLDVQVAKTKAEFAVRNTPAHSHGVR